MTAIKPLKIFNDCLAKSRKLAEIRVRCRTADGYAFHQAAEHFEFPSTLLLAQQIVCIRLGNECDECVTRAHRFDPGKILGVAALAQQIDGGQWQGVTLELIIGPVQIEEPLFPARGNARKRIG